MTLTRRKKCENIFSASNIRMRNVIFKNLTQTQDVHTRPENINQNNA